MAAGEQRWVRAGRVGRPHGLDGSFFVTWPRVELLEVGRAVTVAGRRAPIVRRAGTAERPIVRLEGWDDRDAAQSLRGEELLVPREETPPLGEDEWYADELEGCEVHDEDRRVGVVRRLVALPSCEVLEVERDGGGELLVPLVRDAVREIDVEGRRVEIDLRFLEGGEGD